MPTIGRPAPLSRSVAARDLARPARHARPAARLSAQRAHVGAAARAGRDRLARHRAAAARLRRRRRRSARGIRASMDDYAGDVIDLLDALHDRGRGHRRPVDGRLRRVRALPARAAIFPRHGARRHAAAGRYAGRRRRAQADAGARAREGRGGGRRRDAAEAAVRRRRASTTRTSSNACARRSRQLRRRDCRRDHAR